jgi:UDP-glucose 4-epimerase
VRYLVTGGAGFIGHHLVGGLLDRGDEVVVLDDLSTGQLDRLEPVLDRITMIEGSILDEAVLDAAMEGCAGVLHEAALASVARSVRDPITSNEVNVTGTLRVMLAAARAGVGRVVFAGSSSVYGSGGELPRRETQRCEPASPYATTKLAGEAYVHAMGELLGIETASLRYFNVYGPGQDPHSEYAAVVPRFVTAALAGEEPMIFGDGTTTRDFTYVDDVVQANLCALDAPALDALTCNVGDGDRHSLLDLVAMIGDAVGRPLTPSFTDPRPGDVHDSQADIGLARERLGYEPRVGLAEGISRTVAWYRSAS